MKIKNIIINIITIFMFCIAIMPNYSNASTNEFISFNNAPRKYFSVSKNKLADISITIEDNNGIKSIELYAVDSKGSNQKKISFSAVNTSNSKKHIYKLSNKNLLKGKTRCFYIKIEDGAGNIHYSGFRVCANSKYVNGKTIKYYSIDDGPRVQNWYVNRNYVVLTIKDNVGTKYAKIKDGNNQNKQIYNFKNLAKGAVEVKIDMTKFKSLDGIYKLRVETEDRNSQKSIRTVFLKMNVSIPNVEVVQNKSVSSFIASLDKISKRVEKDYKSGKRWKYTNGVNSINKLPFKYTFEEAINTNTLTTNCADYVMWALHESGVLSANQKFYGNSKGGITYKKNSTTKVEKTLKENANIIKVNNKTTNNLI